MIKVNWGSRLEVQECGSVHDLQECDRCFQEEVRVGAAKAGAQIHCRGITRNLLGILSHPLAH